MNTIGKLIAKLEKLPKDAPVHFTMGWAYPTTIDSYRGYYAQAALGYAAYNYATDSSSTTVASLLEELRSAIDGRTFMGWKGGEYRYTENTPLWVDNPGAASRTRITHVYERHGIVYLATEHEP